jgi:monoamine oxidase
MIFLKFHISLIYEFVLFRIGKSILSIVLASCCCLFTTAIIITISFISFYLPNRSVSLRINTKSLRIAIVGAGISGLNAGLTLLDSNLFSPNNIFIYEANLNIGGRIHTRFWLPDNQTSEWCGEHFSSNNYVMRNLTDRFNISLIDTIEESNPAYVTTYYFLKRFYNETQAWIDYKSIESIIREQLAQIGSVTYNQSNSYGRYFDNLSFYDWIEQFVPNGHQSSFGQYLDSAYTQEFGVDTQALNCLMFLQLINPDSQPEDGPLSIYGSFDQRYQMKGGNDQLPTKIGQYLTDYGVTIALAHNLTKIRRLDKRYQLTFSNNVTSIFDHVILTIPLTVLRYVDYSKAQFGPLKIRVINELNYGTNTKLNLQFSKRFWYNLSVDGNIYTDLPFLSSWEESLGQPGNSGILVLFTGREL